MYDYRFNPPRKVAADADTLSRRLREAAGPLPVSKARIDAVVARVAADPARALADARAAERDAKAREKAAEAERKKRETEAARALAREQATAARQQARVEKERATRDPVEAQEVPAKVLAGFLKDAMKDAPERCVVAAQRVEDEVWIGVVRSGGEFDYTAAVRVPASAAPGVRSSLLGCKLGEAANVVKALANGYADIEKHLLAPMTAAASVIAAFDNLSGAWRGSGGWSHTNLSRSARLATDFAPEAGGKYGLDCVLWDDVSSGITATMLVRERLLSDAPLHGYGGAFVATDGSRLAIIGVEDAPAGGSIAFPRGMLDYCDPREAWGKRYGRNGAVAIGPFLFFGQYAAFPDYRQVLPRLDGLAFRFGVEEMEAVEPSYPLAGMKDAQIARHAEFTTRSDGTIGDIAVRYVPKDGDTCDYDAFPARFVMQNAVVHDLGASTGSGNPRLFRATFFHDAFKAIRAGGEQSAVFTLPGQELAPSAVVTPAQMHIIMPVRDDDYQFSRKAFASAKREAFQPYNAPDTVGAVSHYPEAVAFNTTGASYHALFRVITRMVKPSVLRVAALPVRGPSGYETWIIPAGTDTAMRLPGAKIDRAYDANDSTKADALMVQIFAAKRTLPARLSPGCPGGTLLEMSFSAATRVMEPVTDKTLSSEYVTVPSVIAGSAIRYLPEDWHRLPRAAFIAQDGTLLATDGYRVYVAPGAVPDMQTVDVGGGFVALPEPVLYEIEQGAEELYVGATALAAGRVVAKRPDQRPPDALTFVQRIREMPAKAIYTVENLEAFIRALTVASKKLRQRNPTAVFSHGKVVSLGSAGTVSEAIVHATYDAEGRADVGIDMDYLVDALASLRDSGYTKGRLVLRGPLDAVSVESDDETQPFSMVMPLRLE